MLLQPRFITVWVSKSFLRFVGITSDVFCLVLATKDLIRLEQVEAYDSVLIKII